MLIEWELFTELHNFRDLLLLYCNILSANITHTKKVKIAKESDLTDTECQCSCQLLLSFQDLSPGHTITVLSTSTGVSKSE